MYWESFSCEIQSDEIIPEEYEDWCLYCLTGESQFEEVKAEQKIFP